MTEPLLDQLAQRFYEVDRQFMPSSLPWAQVEADLQAPYLRYAREALRQMEWSFYLGFCRGEQREYEYDEARDLSLAPPDWLP